MSGDAGKRRLSLTLRAIGRGGDGGHQVATAVAMLLAQGVKDGTLDTCPCGKAQFPADWIAFLDDEIRDRAFPTDDAGVKAVVKRVAGRLREAA